ncbi:MAG: AmmeMemoRadiSam system protein A [Gammaproteobacteria bacterium]|nr:AmmeMemoRadiSam system protein A [Gammaproteobacteria bacterium]MDH3465825.1 AmmeMemoRadiSam system protein A [Gammaproteobacteria bacterium]
MNAEQQTVLRSIAIESIHHGLRHGCALAVDTAALKPPLSVPGASFVTLRRGGQLRGCVGTLAADHPLAVDVSINAYNAAFRDPRFSPLTTPELSGFSVSISVLGTPQPLRCRDEGDLLRQLRPGIDGLTITEGPHRGTFLPSVWSNLVTPHEFVRELKHKAGLARDYWSESIVVERYTTETW